MTKKEQACLHYSHELKNRAHELLNVEFKRGSQLAIFTGMVDYLSNHKDLALKVAQHVQLFMPKTQSATTKATKTLSRQSVGATKKELALQSEEILNTLKATNPELYQIMKSQMK